MSEFKPALAQFFVEIGGSIPQGLMDDLAEVVVDTNNHMPAMFTIHLYDKELEWIDNDLLSIGQKVKIKAQAAQQADRSGAEDVLVEGEITAIEPDFDETGLASVIIRGYTKDHRLHRGKKTRSFLEMTDADIVKKVAGEAGLSAVTDSTSVKYEYVLQNNQTDYEFLLARAQRIGFQLYAQGDKLYFVKADKEDGSGPVAKWGENLRQFRPHVTSAQQENEVIVKGWDPKTKKEVIGRATTGKELTPEIGYSNQGASFVSGKFGNAQAVVVQRPVSTQDEAQALAKAMADEISAKSVRAEGRVFGEPKLKAGRKVTVESVGNRFSGSYYVSSATHVYSPEQGYETSFTISGRKPETLSHLLDPSLGGAGAHDQGTRIYGVVIGIVDNHNDPEDMGRIRVKFPWLSDADTSHWARLAGPMAGPDRGMYYMPEMNDEVLVAFEHGDMNYPYIVGTLWNGKDKPPLPKNKVVDGAGKVIRRLIKTREGHQVMLVDEKGAESIQIIDKTGKNEIFIDSVKNDIIIRCDNNFVVEAKGKIMMTAQADASIESKTGKFTAKAQAGVSVETPASATLKATGSMTVESSGSTAVKGSVVQVQGSGPVTIKGTPIALN